MEDFYMFVGGEFVNTNIVSNDKEVRELEQYCKLEGVCSVGLRKEINKLCSIKRKIFIEDLFKKVKKVFINNKNIFLR